MPVQASSSVGNESAIKYTLTRGNLLVVYTLALAYNRIMQIVALLGVLVLAIFIIWVARPDSFAVLIVALLSAITGWLVLLFIALGLTTIAIVFLLKHRGILGEHVLEISERGLLERTEFHETLAKWPSICRIRSTRWFLFIYVNDLQFHAVPRRHFAKEQMEGFESALRTHLKGMK